MKRQVLTRVSTNSHSVGRPAREIGQRSKGSWLFALGVAAMFASMALGVSAKKKVVNPNDEQKRALHAIDRLTFGPQPGQVQAVAQMGVDKWVAQQLHPEKIAETGIAARLTAYRTLQMSTSEMVRDFPPDVMARAVMDGKLPLPSDPYRRAIYLAEIDRLQAKGDRKQAVNATATSQPVSEPMTASATSAASASATAPAMMTPPSFSAIDAGSVEEARQKQNHQRALVLDDELAQLTPDARMQRILKLTQEEQSNLLRDIPAPKREALLAGLSPEQRETVQALTNPAAVIDSEVQDGKLLRAVYSDRQLEEVLTDFWFNHFNVYIGKSADHYLITAYERDVIRPHVLGKFKDLLLATAKSPAMLFYLDNWQSEGPNSDAALGRPEHPNVARSVARGAWANAPFPRPVSVNPMPRPKPQPQGNAQKAQSKRRNGLNENYARELMELHTLGVNGGYTQKDVTEVARVFTGWTLQEPRDGGGFVFKPRMHEPGQKTVLGHAIKENGESEGVQVLNILARSPATAQFISRELAQRFVSDDPPQPLVDAMAKTFGKTDGDLREVMRTMLCSPEFWAPEAYRARVKTPFEYVVSALRATNADIQDPQPLLGVLNRMGMPLYGMQPPTGYSTKADVWVNSSALLDRMNFALALVNNKLPGIRVDVNGLEAAGSAVPAAPDDPYQTQLRLEQAILQGETSQQTHDVIEQQLANSQVSPGTKNPKPMPSENVIAALLLGSPDFQRK